MTHNVSHFVGLDRYKHIKLDQPIEALISRYKKLEDCLIDTEVRNVILIAALRQQFTRNISEDCLKRFVQHISFTGNFLLPVILEDEQGTKTLALYAVPPNHFKATKVISMSQALFINVPWWEPDEVRLLTFKDSADVLIWTHSANDDYTIVGDHNHFRHAAPHANLQPYELLYTNNNQPEGV